MYSISLGCTCPLQFLCPSPKNLLKFSSRPIIFFAQANFAINTVPHYFLKNTNPRFICPFLLRWRFKGGDLPRSLHFLRRTIREIVKPCSRIWLCILPTSSLNSLNIFARITPLCRNDRFVYSSKNVTLQVLLC